MCKNFQCLPGKLSKIKSCEKWADSSICLKFCFYIAVSTADTVYKCEVSLGLCLEIVNFSLRVSTNFQDLLDKFGDKPL